MNPLPICIKCKEKIEHNEMENRIDTKNRHYQIMKCQNCGHENKIKFGPDKDGGFSYWFTE